MCPTKLEIKAVSDLTSNSKRDIARELNAIWKKLAEVRDVFLGTFTAEEVQELLNGFNTLPARAHRDSTFTPSGNEAVPFDVVDFDAGGYFSTSTPTKAVFVVGAVYRVRSFIIWDGAAGVLQLRLNGVDILAEGSESVETIWSFSAGDYVEVLVDDAISNIVAEIERVSLSPFSPRVL